MCAPNLALIEPPSAPSVIRRNMKWELSSCAKVHMRAPLGYERQLPNCTETLASLGIRVAYAMKEAGTPTMAALELPLYLPVPGTTVWADPNPGTVSSLGIVTRLLAGRLSNLAVDLSTTDSPAPSDVQRELGLLANIAAAGIEDSQETIAALAASNSRESSDEVMVDQLAGELPLATIERYRAYDHYFNVVRAGRMTAEEMMTQILVVCERLLADLPNAFLARDELVSLLIGLAIMISGDGLLDECNDSRTPDAVPSDPAPTAPNHGQLYRWIVGHQVYFLATGYCRRFLDIGLDPTQDGEAQARTIGIAGSLLRATTGAMWYASELSPAAYLNQVRPSMPPDGFSGEHNSDHVLLRSSKEELLRTAMTMAKAPERPWEHKVLSNMERFLEIDLENTEAHILLAASKVGRQASLAQSAAVGEDHLPQTTAVDMLRAIGKHKQSLTAPFFRSQLKRRGYLHSGYGGPNAS